MADIALKMLLESFSQSRLRVKSQVEQADKSD